MQDPLLSTTNEDLDQDKPSESLANQCNIQISSEETDASHKSEGSGSNSNELDSLKAEQEPNHALVSDPRVNKVIRYIIPILLVLNIGVFFRGVIAEGASIGLVLSCNKYSTKTYVIQSYNLIDSVQDMWNAKVYPLAILVAAFSGIWPYVKLLMMMACWLIPPSRLSVKKREKTLIFLDTVGKYSLIDGYILVMMVVSFRYHLEKKFWKIDGQLNEIVEPKFGFYGYLIATVFSLVNTHIVLHNHRKTFQNQSVDHDQEKITLSHNRTRRQKLFLQAMLIICLISLIVGACYNTFSFTYEGAAGWAQGWDENSKTYSLISLGYKLPGKTAHPNSFGIRFIQVTYFLYAFVTPILFVVVLYILWVVPMRLGRQKIVFQMAEILNAWSAIEVFIVAIVASLTEIRQFATWMLGDNCDKLNAILKDLAKKGIIDLHGDDVCFDLVTKLTSGCFVLFGTAVLYFIFSTIVLRQCQAQLNDRINSKLSIQSPRAESTKLAVKQ